VGKKKMKSIALILLSLLVCQLTLCTLVDLSSERRRSHHRRSHHRRSRSRGGKGGARPSGNTLYVSSNKWGSLFYGILSGLTSVSSVGTINKCLPSAWQAHKVTASRSQSSNPEGNNVKMFLDLLSKVINFVCKFKNKIKGLFKKKLHLRNRKVFLQLSSARWGWKNFRNVVKSFRRAVNTVKNVVRKVGKGASNLWKKISGGMTAAVSKIKGLFLMIKNQLQKIFNFEFLQRLVKNIVPCLKTLKSMGRTIYNIVTGIVKKITTISSRGFVGLGEVFVDLVCQFDKFRAAAHELVRGLNESHENRKFFYFGTFAGQLLSAIGTARFMRMGLFLMKY